MILILRAIFALGMPLSIFILKDAYIKNWFKYLIFALFNFGMVVSLVQAYCTEEIEFKAAQIIELNYIFITISNLK